MRKFLPGVLILLAGLSGCSREVMMTFTVTNSLDMNRPGEVVEVPVDSKLEALLSPQTEPVCVAEDGHLCSTQVVDDNGDGEAEYFVFQDNFEALSTQRYELVLKEKKADSLDNGPVYAMFVPQRMDDFAWENDKIAFRMYGPALQATGEISSGIDAWCKNVSYPILEKWYSPGMDYHTDHGEGGDFYKVGRSAGNGGTAFIYKNHALFSDNFISWHIIAKGPLRTIFELDYAPWTVATFKVSEKKRIQLDAGSHFNYITSTYSRESGTIPDGISVGAGIPSVNHPGLHYLNPGDESCVASFEPLEHDNGFMGQAVFSADPDAYPVLDADEHRFLLFPFSDDDMIVEYFAGFYWNKESGIDTDQAFMKQVKIDILKRRQPLTVDLME